MPVTTEVLAAVKASHSKYKAEKDLEQETKRKAEEKAKGEAEAKKVREEKEEKISSAFLFASCSRSFSALYLEYEDFTAARSSVDTGTLSASGDLSPRPR